MSILYVKAVYRELRGSSIRFGWTCCEMAHIRNARRHTRNTYSSSFKEKKRDWTTTTTITSKTTTTPKVGIPASGGKKFTRREIKQSTRPLEHRGMYIRRLFTRRPRKKKVKCQLSNKPKKKWRDRTEASTATEEWCADVWPRSLIRKKVWRGRLQPLCANTQPTYIGTI